jgi:hypothetical protein
MDGKMFASIGRHVDVDKSRNNSIGSDDFSLPITVQVAGRHSAESKKIEGPSGTAVKDSKTAGSGDSRNEVGFTVAIHVSESSRNLQRRSVLDILSVQRGRPGIGGETEYLQGDERRMRTTEYGSQEVRNAVSREVRRTDPRSTGEKPAEGVGIGAKILGCPERQSGECGFDGGYSQERQESDPGETSETTARSRTSIRRYVVLSSSVRICVQPINLSA